MYGFECFATLDFKLAAQHVLGVVDIVSQDVADGQEAGLFVLDYTAIGRNACLAISKRVERIDGLVA